MSMLAGSRRGVTENGLGPMSKGKRGHSEDFRKKKSKIGAKRGSRRKNDEKGIGEEKKVSLFA